MPAENAADENNVPPAKWTAKHRLHDATVEVAGFRHRLGTQEIATCDPSYYRWEQWLFTRLYERAR